MKRTLYCLALVLAFLSMGQSATASDLVDGFLGTPWNAPSSAVEGLEKIYQQGDLSYFAKSDAVYTVGDVELQEVMLGFYRDRFFAVYLRIDSENVFRDVKAYMQSKYGFPKTTWSASGSQAIFRWKHENIKMKLKTGDRNGRMKLGFYYTPVSSKVNENEQEASREKAYELLPIRRDKKPDYLPLLHF